ncbi:WXG100 family type VII secretion target [Streptomyces sp. 900116325]
MATPTGDTAALTASLRMGALEAEPLARAARQPAEVGGKVLVAKEKDSGGGRNNSGGQGGTMSPAEFHVALGELRRAIGVVRGESEDISGLIGQIENHFEAAHTSWQSPSASSFEVMSSWFARASRELEALLRDMASRMQSAYDNYAAAEHANTQNSGG